MQAHVRRVPDMQEGNVQEDATREEMQARQMPAEGRWHSVHGRDLPGRSLHRSQHLYQQPLSAHNGAVTVRPGGVELRLLRRGSRVGGVRSG